ncbi:hypothetical protein Tco_0111440 [Tanacetum coccineum]
MNDDTPMCECHEANYIQSGVNNVKNDLENFKSYIRSKRTDHDNLFDEKFCKPTGDLPNKKSKTVNQEAQSKTDLEKLITKFLDGQRVANMFVKNNEEGKTLEKAYYTQFGAPYQPGGQYRAAGPGFYQRNNGNSSYPDRRPSLEESLTKFMAESAKRHEENSNIIKEIRASTDAAIRNQGASIKTLEIQIGQMSKVLQERGFGSLPSSMETNPRDQVKSISTAKADFSGIRRIGCGPYAVSGTQHRSILSEKNPFSKSTAKLQL